MPSTDAEAIKHLRAAVEFIEAVEERDLDWVEACLRFTEPRILAVWCADLLLSTRELVKLREGERDEARAETAEARAETESVRGELHAAEADVQGAVRRAERSREQLRSEMSEVRAQLTAAHSRIAKLQGDLYIANQRKDAA